MKRIAASIMISSMLLVFTACGQTENRLFPRAGQGTGQETIKQEENNAKSGENVEENIGPDNTKVNDKESADAARLTDDKDRPKTGIIAKSDNIVANQDKEAILKELENELDELITSINELDDLEDSDLE